MKKAFFSLLFLTLSGCALFSSPAEEFQPTSCANIDKRVKIVYEDDDLLIVNKPAGIISVTNQNRKEESMLDLLRIKSACVSPDKKPKWYYKVHRLDRNTQGLMIFAKNEKAQKYMLDQFADRKVEKRYRTVVEGVISQDKGTINKPITDAQAEPVHKMKIAAPGEGLASVTEYTVIKRLPNATYVDVRTRTGRQHQVRLHLASIGHPVFSDRLYGATYTTEFLKNHLLQAYYLKFKKPFSNEILELELSPSDKILEAIDFAEKPKK